MAPAVAPAASAEVSVQPVIRRAPAEDVQPPILRRRALPAEPATATTVMPLVSVAGAAGPAASEAPAAAPAAAPVVTEFGPAIRRRSTGAPAPLPLAELRRKALGSDDEEEARGTVQRSLASVPASSPIQILPPGPGLIPGLPAGGPPPLVQRSAAPGAPSPRPSGAAAPAGQAPLSNAAAGLSMPLARAAAQPAAPATPASAGPGLIQRLPNVGPADGGMAPGSLPTPVPDSAGAEPAAGAEPTNEDELAERVLRRLMRTLAVEGERRGLRRWP